MRFCAGGSRVGVRAPSSISMSVEKRIEKKRKNFLSMSQIFAMWSQRVIRNEECESLKKDKRAYRRESALMGFRCGSLAAAVWVSQTETQNQLKIPGMQHSVPCVEEQFVGSAAFGPGRHILAEALIRCSLLGWSRSQRPPSSRQDH